MKKRSLYSFIVILYICSFGLYFIYYDTSSFQQLIKSSNIAANILIIPDDMINNDPSNLDLLKQSAIKYNVNIFKSVSNSSSQGTNLSFSDYIFITSKSKYFDNINVKNNFNWTNNSKAFISNKQTNDENQIGLIKDFGTKNFDFFIYSIDKYILNYPLSGVYKIEADSETFEQFLNYYVDLINTTYSIKDEYKFSIDDFTSQNSGNSIEITNQDFSLYIIIFLILIGIILMVYYFISNAKQISILKLNGFSVYKIWTVLFFKDFNYIYFYINILFFLSFLCIPNNNFDFVLGSLSINLGIYLFIIFISCFIIIYIHKIKITLFIKGKKSYKLALFINFLFKIILSVIMIFLISLTCYNITDLFDRYKSLEVWDKISDFGLLLTYKVGEDEVALKNNENPLDAPSSELYFYLNNLGSLYIDATDFEEYILDDQYKRYIETGIPYLPFATANPNYLNLFPIYDENNKKIVIDEAEKALIYLIPEGLKGTEREKEYLKLLIRYKESYEKIETEYYNRELPHGQRDYRVIYIKQNQNIPTFNPNVYSSNNNCILNPVVRVITESNSLVAERFYLSSSHIFFIKLKDQNPELTYSSILGELKKYHLDDNFPYLFHANSLLADTINNIKYNIRYDFINLILLTLFFIILIINNLYLYFSKYELEIFIKQTMGLNFFVRYKQIIISFILSFILEFIILSIVLDYNFILIFFIKILFELTLICFVIKYFSTKNIIKVLKRG